MERWIAERLAIGSLEGAVVIAVVWLACRRPSVVPASVQAALWWCASLKLVLAFAPLPAIAIPLLPADDRPLAAPQVSLQLTTALVPPEPAVNWVVVAVVTLWGLVVVAQAVRLLSALAHLRGIVSRSRPLPAAHAAVAASLAHVGGARVPRVRASTEIASPLVAGIGRPVVLVPADLSGEPLRMALCHEFVHVRRHDLALGWIPALAERLFFFHPLARLAAREYVTAREAACDAAVLRTLGVQADRYARLLLQFGIARAQSSLAVGGAPGSLSSLRRRLDMLNHAAPAGRSPRVSWLLVAAVMLAIVPFELSARATPQATAAPAPVPQAAPPPPPAEPGTAAPVPAPLPAQTPDSPAPAPPAARPVPVPLPTGQAVPPALDEVLNQMRALDREIKAGTELRGTETIRETLEQAVRGRERVRQYNALAEEANRLARLHETQLALERQGRTETLVSQFERLRAQQEVLRRQMELLAEQQRRLTEAQMELLREADRIREELKR